MYDLNEVSFYAHSLAICEVAQRLRDPAARDQIVERGADALIRASEEVAGGVSALPNRPNYLEDAYAGLIRDAYDSRPAPERLAGEMTLSLTIDRRETAQPKFWASRSIKEGKYAVFTEGVIGRMNRDAAATMTVMGIPQGLGLMLETGEKSPRMETIIRSNIVLSAAYIAALIARDLAPQVEGGELPSQEFVDMLRHRSTKQAALQACEVTSGEFFDTENPIVEIVDGQTQFKDPLNGRERPKPSMRRQYYERHTPLVCPAADVRSMVPLSLDLVGRIVGRATEQLSHATSQRL